MRMTFPLLLVLSFSAVAVLASESEEQPSYLSSVLGKFHEPALWDLDGPAESYRIYVDASIVFRESVVRLDRVSADRWRLTTKTRFHNRWRTWTQHLRTPQVAEAVARLNDEKFWQLPADMEFVDADWKGGDQQTVCVDELLHVPLEFKHENHLERIDGKS